MLCGEVGIKLSYFALFFQPETAQGNHCSKNWGRVCIPCSPSGANSGFLEHFMLENDAKGGVRLGLPAHAITALLWTAKWGAELTLAMP